MVILMTFGIPTLSGCHKLKIKNKVWLRADSVSQNIPTEETLPLYTLVQVFMGIRGMKFFTENI